MNEHQRDTLMQRLASEMNICSILCIIEMVQFKYAIQETHSLNIPVQEQKVELNVTSNLLLSTICENEEVIGSELNGEEISNSGNDLQGILNNDSIPRSTIVYESNRRETIEDHLEIAHKLYIKYLHVENDDSNELTVDISPTLKSCFDADMDMDLDEFIECSKKKNVTVEDLFEYFDPVIDTLCDEIGSNYFVIG